MFFGVFMLLVVLASWLSFNVKLARKVRVNISLRSLVIFRILEYPWL